MCNRFLLPFLWCLCATGQLPAQETVIHYFHPLLSPAITERASGVQGAIRALVVGVGQYQQTGFAALPYARRDAEAFAAFLKTPAGGSVSGNDLMLLTNETASLARVSEALDALVDGVHPGDKIVVYCTLQGQIKARGEARLLFYDSPPAPTDAGFLALSRLSSLLGEAAARNGARILLVVEIAPCNTSEKALSDWSGMEAYGSLFREKLTMPLPDSANGGQEGKTFGNTLLNGLLGMADQDYDQKVYVPELLRYLRDKDLPFTGNASCALLAFSDNTDWVCKTSAYTREKLVGQTTPMLTPIVQLEVQPLDDFMSRHADAATRRLYEDFILTIRLGQLLEPPERCASSLLDSLLQVETLAAMHKTLQRRLAVAYQDEAQQALNAYLQANVKELTRRRKDHGLYQLYPEYLRRTIEILGPAHFMHQLLEAKRLYFEGLALRLRFDHTADTSLLPKALDKQRQAIALEPEAAFIYNEIGVVCFLSNQLDSAAANFRQATEFAPAWGIPHANLGAVLSRQGQSEKAIEEGVTAISLNSWSPGMYVNLGEIYQNKKDLKAAEITYRRALRIDPDFPDAHYDLACVQSLNGQQAAALESLRLALKNGFNRPEHLLADPDLQALRDTAAFQVLYTAFFPERKE